MPEKYKAFDNEITKKGRLSHSHAKRKHCQATDQDQGRRTQAGLHAGACNRICQREKMKR